MATQSQKLTQKQWMIAGGAIIGIFVISKYFAKI